MEKTEEKRLNSIDFSAVWKDGGNVQETSGLKLNLVEHLEKQRLLPDWVQMKESLVKKMELANFPEDYEISILDIGCGIGIDLLLVANAAIESKRKARIVGLDFNTLMVETSTNLVEKNKNSLPNNIKIEVIKGDITQMEFQEGTFDIVRSDITIQHVNLDKALPEIYRVLKPGGLFISLEGGSSNVYSNEPFIIKINDKVLPKSDPPAVKLYFQLPKVGFDKIEHITKPLITYGPQYQLQDPGWVKLKGMGQMLIDKAILSKEESEEYQVKYIQACENNNIMGIASVFLTTCRKKSA